MTTVEAMALLEVAGLTLHRALLGIAVAVVLAVLVQEVRARGIVLDRLYRPLLLVAYSVPAFGLSLFAGAVELPRGYDWLIVGITLIVPMEMAMAAAAAEADVFDRIGVGSEVRRLWHIRLPAMAPMLLLGLALAVPWALLSAMLLEVAEGQDGLGSRLSNGGQLGFRAQVPTMLVIAGFSAGGFLALTAASRRVRRLLGLDARGAGPVVQTPTNLLLGPGALLWALVLVTFLWWALHRCFPVTVGSPFDPRPFSNLLPGLGLRLVQTLLSSFVGGLSGVALATVAAVVVLAKPWSRRLFDAALLPMQVVPLQVFAPFLLVFALATAPAITFTTPAPLGIDWPATCVGFCASAFVAFQFLGPWLTLLPGRSSGTIAARPLSDRRLVRHVLGPWLERGLAIAFPAMMPRLLAGVLATEYLVTQRGLGGALATTRGDRGFKETFVLLMVIVFVVLASQGLASLAVPRAGSGRRVRGR